MLFHKFLLWFFGISWLIFSNYEVSAQNKQGANWLFASKVHLDFNASAPVVNNFNYNPADSLFSGVASISDKNGQLLFFTSKGVLVSRQKINGVYQAMPNGRFYTLRYNNSTFAEMIVQSPADSNIYYLFFIARFFTTPFTSVDLYKAEVDMRLNNGYGDVIPNSVQLVKRNVDQYKLTALLHQNNRDTWIMTSSAFNGSSSSTVPDTIATLLLTPQGISAPVITALPFPLGAVCRLKASPNSEMFVVTSEIRSATTGSLTSQTLQLFNFNQTTGIPTLRYSLPGPNLNYPIFSYAFSPDNSKLYTGNANVLRPFRAIVDQYDLLAGNATQVQQSRNVIFNGNNFDVVGDIQLGIDGKLYLYIKATHLSQIKCPNFYGAACNFQLDAVDLKTITGGYSLPTLNQTLFRNAGKLQAQADLNTICKGDTVQLSAFGAGAEQFRWQAANGLPSSSETLANPLVNPTNTTTYRVIGTSACDNDTAFVKVTVLPKIPGVTLAGPLQVSSLTEQEYFVQHPAPGSTFNWLVSGGTIKSGQNQSRMSVNWGTAGEGNVRVTEIPQTGCIGQEVSLKVQLTEGPDPKIYNVFTPDNDGKNDAFVIENLKWYPESELKIYNRWGQEVYQSSNYQNNWQAEKLSAGVYYYFFTANGKSWKGWVEVIK